MPRSPKARARTLGLPKGARAVFDRVYFAYNSFTKLTASDVHFVARLKTNAAFVVVESRRAVWAVAVRMWPAVNPARR